MRMRFYLDSNVFISFVREEMDSAFNLRYVDSGNFFAFCRKERITLILSDLFFKEVERIISLKKADILEEFKRHKINVVIDGKSPSKVLVSKVMKECRIHFSDATHVAIAQESKVNAVITWNKKDFSKAKKFVKCFSPSDVLEML